MALKRISLRDFVIVDALELDLKPGFTALTGETGAGKSILIDALQLTLGARADASVVREGAERADVCAEFDLTAPVQAWLQQAGLDGHDSLLMRRTVDTQGKSRAWINGTPATAAQLRQLGDLLLDIHGQHAWQSLTRPESVRTLLDAYGRIDTRALDAAWQNWRQAVAALDSARAAQTTLQRERERLSWQIGEVDKLSPAAGEWEELSHQHTRLSHLQALLEAARQASAWLEGADTEVDGALSLLGRAQSALQEQEHLEPEFKSLCDVLASALANAEDAAHSLNAYLRRTDLDPDRLSELDQRMAQWLGLARRYRHPPAELPALLAGWKQELATLDEAVDLPRLERQTQQAQSAYLEAAREVSRGRKAAGPKLARAITAAMQSLGMKGGRFEVALLPLDAPAASGLESVEFLVSGHAGSSPKPVGKVASGGELSRIALAIAVTTSELGEAQTLIFDEVDSGVGGAVAQTVGQLMRRLGRDRQVLAVTHLAQVAACAHQHLVVAKQTRKGRAASTVAAVEDEGRVTEIARMLGGETQSATSLAHAREMMAAAQQPSAGS